MRRLGPQMGIGPGAGPGSGSSYTSLQVQLGAAAWYRSDDASKFSLASGKVVTWTDAIASATVTQATDARRPSYTADFGDGGPAVTFDGTAVTFLQQLGTPPVNPNADYTVIALVRAHIDQRTAWSIADFSNANRHLMLQYLFSNHKHRLLADSGSDLDLNNANAAVDTWNVSILRRTGTTCKNKIDGAAETTAVQSGATVTTNSTTFGGLEAGTGSGTVAAPWDGAIREVQFYPLHLSDANVTTLRDDLRSRYPNVI